MNSNNNKPGKNKNIKFYIIYFLSVLVMVTVFNYFANDIRNQKQTYNEFNTAIMEDRVASIKLDESQRKFEYTMVEGDELSGFTLYTGQISNDEDIIKLIKEKEIPLEVATVQVANPIMTILLSWILPPWSSALPRKLHPEEHGQTRWRRHDVLRKEHSEAL